MEQNEVSKFSVYFSSFKRPLDLIDGAVVTEIFCSFERFFWQFFNLFIKPRTSFLLPLALFSW